MPSSPSLLALGLALSLAAAAPALVQVGRVLGMGYPGGRSGASLPPPVPNTGKQPPAKKDKNADQEILPSFRGTLRGIDSKSVVIEEESANTLQFNCTRKTKYVDGSKKIKASDFKPGEPVSVDARHAPDGSLDAVVVRRERRKS